jgi:hypothetical protein
VSSKEQDLRAAWQAIDDGDHHSQALDLALPWAKEGDWEASTLCALAYLYSGESDLCDEWTLNAGGLGAKEIWLNEQSDFDDFAILVARIDALASLRTEGLTPLEANMALQRYLLNGSLEYALYYSVKAVRILWESSLVNKEVNAFANLLISWIITSNFTDKDINSILENLSTCVAGALSTREAFSLISGIKDSLTD